MRACHSIAPLAPCPPRLIIYGFDQAYRQEFASTSAAAYTPTPTAEALTGIPDCSQEIYIKTPCYDLIYTPASSAVATAIVGLIQVCRGAGHWASWRFCVRFF